MSGIQERRDRRYNFQIPVTLASLKGDVTLMTENVSYRGIFLRTNAPPPRMQLCRLRATVPTMTNELVTNVIVVHVAAADAPVQGAGFSFYGLDGQPRADWEKFIQYVRDNHPDAAERQAAADFAAVQAGRRKAKELILAVANMSAFQRLVARDIAHGKVVIHTPAQFAVGEAVSVRLIHPVRHDDFILEGVAGLKLPNGGLSVQLPKMDAAKTARFVEFVDAGSDQPSIDLLAFASMRPRAMSAPPVSIR